MLYVSKSHLSTTKDTAMSTIGENFFSTLWIVIRHLIPKYVNLLNAFSLIQRTHNVWYEKYVTHLLANFAVYLQRNSVSTIMIWKKKESTWNSILICSFGLNVIFQFEMVRCWSWRSSTFFQPIFTRRLSSIGRNVDDSRINNFRQT